MNCSQRNRCMHRRWREEHDPFEDMTDVQFKKSFRLTKTICREFVDILKPFLKGRKKAYGLTKEARILCALRFYATGIISGFESYIFFNIR